MIIDQLILQVLLLMMLVIGRVNSRQMIIRIDLLAVLIQRFQKLVEDRDSKRLLSERFLLIRTQLIMCIMSVIRASQESLVQG